MKEFGNVRKNCLWLLSSRETIKVAKRSKVSLKRELRKTGIRRKKEGYTFRYGLPRFVTFIICEDVAWGVDSGMAGGSTACTSNGRAAGGNGGEWGRERGGRRKEKEEGVDEE